MSRKGIAVLGTFIDALSWDDAIERIIEWAEIRESRYICICNVHSVVTALRDTDFMKMVNEADMATADGAPIAWALRRLGFVTQERINGPDLMWKYLGEAERLGQTVFFYGSTENALTRLRISLAEAFPSLNVAGMHSPPFRSLSRLEEEEVVDMINSSGCHVVFVGLGCPKQEKWLATHRGRINSVMIGVGAAFDYHSGTLKRAPLWMQRNCLEWIYRLFTEPRRLYRRYLVCNTVFTILISGQLFSRILNRRSS